MIRGMACCGALAALCVAAPVAVADTVYTNHADWMAAVSSLGSVRSLSLTPVDEVPDSGAVYADDEGTLYFPDNHGEMSVFADGWRGDVHGGPDDPNDHSPHENRFSFAKPVMAFAATIWIGEDVGPEYDSILLSMRGGDQHRLMQVDYAPGSPGFFGWVGDHRTNELTIGSGAGSHFYSMTGVQYVPAGAASVTGSVQAVPLPPAAWGGLVLLGMGVVPRVWRTRWQVAPR